MLFIYGKDPDKKKFHPMDLGSGSCVIHRLHATSWEDSSLQELTNLVAELEKANPDWRFKIHKQ